MDDDVAAGADGPAPDSSTQPQGRTTLGDDVSQLIAEARSAIDAELAFQKRRAGMAGGAVARIAGFAVLALALLFFVLMALVFGAVLALAKMFGAWVATAIVAGVLLLAVVLAGLGALAGWRKLMWLIGGGDL